MIHCKTHADKGVQTNSLQLSSSGSHLHNSCSVLLQQEAARDHEALDDSCTSEYLSTSRLPHDYNAYIYSEASLDDQTRYISDRLATETRCTHQYGQLGYGKPSHLASISDRIASLPETSPPHRIGQEQTVRLVSMPESLKALRYSQDRLARYSDRPEHFNLSLTSDGTTQTKSSDAEHGLLDGVPPTPSPPSSPESVMIIGNETRVPQTFLRPKSSTDDHDHEGCTPCKGSPPKPIPALHGPLSLPYARCPSGAEGTVIDGEDLTHMIWGLDSTSPQFVPAKSHISNIQNHKPSPLVPPSRHPRQATFARHDSVAQSIYNQDVIDLSQPEFQTTSSNRKNSVQPSKPYFVSTDGVQLSRKDVRNKATNIYEFVRRDSPIQLYPSSFGLLHSETHPWNAGLGIDFRRGSLESGALFSSDTLLPRNDRVCLVLGQPFETVNTPHIYQTPRNLPVAEMRAFEHHGHRPGIPTPPDTESLRWTPCFHQGYSAPTSPETLNNQAPRTHFVDMNQCHITGAKQKSLASPPKLRQIQELLSAMPEYRSGISKPSETVVHRQPPLLMTPDSIITDCSTSLSAISDMQHPPKPHLAQTQPTSDAGPTPPSPVSPELRRNLSQQHPRSIPLARLIQRRLSSVLEEEVEAEDTRNIYRLSPVLSTHVPYSGSELNDGPSSKEDQRVKSKVATSPPGGSTSDHTKRVYKPPGHPARRAPAVRDISTKTQRASGTNQSTAQTNRFGEDKGNAVMAKKTGLKSKKTSRKKKHAKNSEVTTVSDK
ncbi:hypothetical protein AN958_03119 [Leucoagaricus sp. SymC.cos]|nr:hypothetical protein AN958_03119 [Leucoagaricus sp. SymC.cos]